MVASKDHEVWYLTENKMLRKSIGVRPDAFLVPEKRSAAADNTGTAAVWIHKHGSRCISTAAVRIYLNENG